MQKFEFLQQSPSGGISNELEREEREKKMPFIVATYVSACSQGQRTHSARTKNASVSDTSKIFMDKMFKVIQMYL